VTARIKAFGSMVKVLGARQKLEKLDWELKNLNERRKRATGKKKPMPIIDVTEE
jgi:hypothetical protein